MSTAYTGSTRSMSGEAAAYGGLIDTIGGIATVVLTIVALSGFAREVMAAIATIVFGAALLIQGGAVLSEYSAITIPAGAASAVEKLGQGGGLSAMFLVGVAGVVLGVLSLLNISAEVLTAVATIAFGSALVLSSNSVRHLYQLQTIARTTTTEIGGEVLAAELAASAAGVQLVAGLASVVLGILAVSGLNPPILTLVALLVLGGAVILSGSTLSGLVLGFMRGSRSTP
jgi:hypothetical protein